MCQKSWERAAPSPERLPNLVHRRPADGAAAVSVNAAPIPVSTRFRRRALHIDTVDANGR